MGIMLCQTGYKPARELQAIVPHKAAPKLAPRDNIPTKDYHRSSIHMMVQGGMGAEHNFKHGVFSKPKKASGFVL